MTHDVASPLEDQLGSALTEVAEQVSIDHLPAMWPGEDEQQAPSRKVRTFALAALAASLAVGVTFAVNDATSTHARPTASSTTTPVTTPHPPPVLTCPKQLATIVFRHDVAGTATAMVPGTPIALLACRYHGFNQPERYDDALAKSAPFRPDLIAAGLNAQPATDPSTMFCPAEFSERILLKFAYPDGSRLMILVSTSGCRFATNGDRTVRIDPVTLDRLQAVLGKDPTP